ncbi:sugar ABC transporter ATP-binding protein [Mesorhizobium sp. M00.F.Ca.ET.186.01.1.1]|nr:sugar ABC transporter ATP-binding protein [bacterium M00.F.Ca.ET.205.01.1.1]TGU50593.1 sugar ABC transporter ATP-binding protein [bacterium M00.F.Ca.ET.152.01.1.1]TGV34050.1 sugar ABC transporter ATP-binding protein [Mesorhizobium sp. M00.F.Ca.ET.186.01.1.1]TGZ40957.1 sugar ABC transporter ATP-binding protein [bacterium M00.F.Ca.ET.162.01.1.1]
MTTTAPLLAARGVSKAFFGNPVLRDVSISLQPGRVHALLGENGAGKSTLINLLSGALRPDGGIIEVDGRAVARMTPALARQAGIAVVQQELSLTASLSIAENIGLGAYPRRFGLVDYQELAARAKAACELVGLNEKLSTPVGQLSLGRRQMVEIAKALYRKPRVLILDEPTSSLSATETRILTDLLERLRSEGTAILYISHRLNEVMALCLHVTVLKDGTCTADRALEGTDASGLVRLMVGRDPGDLFPRWQAPPSPANAISVRGLSAGLMHGVDLDIRTGEVLGIGGLVGQGQEDLLLGLYGAIPARTTSAAVNGAAGLPAGVPKANALGLAYVPADRKREGLHLIHPILTNMMLPAFARLPALKLRSRKAERERGKGLAAQLGIKGDLGRPAQALSGGNQQKVALAKWMPHDPLVLLLNDPTRGVDVETKREIYLMLRGFAAAGKAVVLLSSDTPELVHLCDRVAVVREGRIVTTLERGALSEEAIVSAAMGAEKQKVAA